MKKLLLLITLFTFSMIGFSQTMLLEEYFSDPENIPTTWTTIDQDGDGNNWRINTYDDEIYIVSDSYRNGTALTPENYLITPQIDLTGLTGTVKLRYTMQVGDDTDFAEHYKVAVSTTGIVVADFSNIVFEETCTANDHYDVPPYWHPRLIDLTPFVGQQIYLTICHYNCTNQYKIMFDSIQVYNVVTLGVQTPDPFKLTVYPNPSTDKVFINGEYDDARLSLISADGRVVYESEKENRYSSINVSQFERGMYILKLETSKGIVTKKLALNH